MIYKFYNDTLTLIIMISLKRFTNVRLFLQNPFQRLIRILSVVYTPKWNVLTFNKFPFVSLCVRYYLI